MKATSAFALVLMLVGSLLFGYVMLFSSVDASCQAYQVSVADTRPDGASAAIDNYAELSLSQQQAFLLALKAPNQTTVVYDSVFPENQSVWYQGESRYVMETPTTLPAAECPDEGGLSREGKILFVAALLLASGTLGLARNYRQKM